MGNAVAYESDFYGWAMEQARLLRTGRLTEADIENIAEEIEGMGRSRKSELVSRLAVMLLHLLKWQFQPGLRGQSWRLSVMNQRDQLASHIEENPSLKPVIPEALSRAYRYARRDAERDTGLPEATFPQVSPWTFEQIMDDGFWPEA